MPTCRRVGSGSIGIDSAKVRLVFFEEVVEIRHGFTESSPGFRPHPRPAIAGAIAPALRPSTIADATPAFGEQPRRAQAERHPARDVRSPRRR